MDYHRGRRCLSRPATGAIGPSTFSRWRHGLAGCVLAVTMVGCVSPSADIPDIADIEADRLLFERGAAALDEADWRRAREYFVEIRDNYPQSQYRAAARLGIGETYVQEGTLEAYIRALDEFQDFLSLYPTHPRAAHAQYQVGMVHFHQMRRAERDQTETVNAVREFEAFIARHPADHELMPEVRQRLREARDRLSAHDFSVGYYYYRFRVYGGAIGRFRQILSDDPGYTRRDEVYFYLAEAHADRGELTEAIPYFARILDEFDASEFAEEARARLAALEAEVEADQDQ